MGQGIIVVGGGLAGLVCASRLSERGLLERLVDSPVKGTGTSLGGFAEFSGAKFSLLPAGRGLVNVAGSERALDIAIRETIELLGLERFPLVPSRDSVLPAAGSSPLEVRGYASYVLSPQQVKMVVGELAARIPHEKIVRSRVKSLGMADGDTWVVETCDAGSFRGSKVVLAAGRTGAELLNMVNAKEQTGKGLDVGVRLHFTKLEALAPLRSMGADAKVLMGNCRTFCLNSPGKIFRYVSELGISIPGGVVADLAETTANVGILCRVGAKRFALSRLQDNLAHAANSDLTYQSASAQDVINHEVLEPLFGDAIVEQLRAFIANIERAHLVDFGAGCTVHYPLIDWHWPVFALDGSFSTSTKGVFVVGDLAGHARGLLQSAVGGWLTGEHLQ